MLSVDPTWRPARWIVLNTSRFIAHFWATTEPAAPAQASSWLPRSEMRSALQSNGPTSQSTPHSPATRRSVALIFDCRRAVIFFGLEGNSTLSQVRFDPLRLKTDDTLRCPSSHRYGVLSYLRGQRTGGNGRFTLKVMACAVRDLEASRYLRVEP